MLFRSIRVWEGSPEGTFMPFWLLKLMLLVFPFVLSLQGFSLLVKSWFIMTGQEPIDLPEHEAEGSGV